VVRELFGDESPLGKEVRVQSVALKVVGVLERTGANMMGIDQDDLLLAPWTTIKFRVAGTSTTTVNPSAASVTTDPTQKVNTLNQLYPVLQNNLYPVPLPTQVAGTPQPICFTNVDQILVHAESEWEIANAIRQITPLLHERHHIRAGQPDDFNIRDRTEISKALGSTACLMNGTVLQLMDKYPKGYCLGCFLLLRPALGFRPVTSDLHRRHFPPNWR
jgi:hypothetical protein